MVFYFSNNPFMDIAKTISANLTAWIGNNPGLDTFKKIAAASGVGFGAVQRAKNGDGNITVEKLSAIASAFKRHPAELLIPATAVKPAEKIGDYRRGIDGEALRLEINEPARPMCSAFHRRCWLSWQPSPKGSTTTGCTG